MVVREILLDIENAYDVSDGQVVQFFAKHGWYGDAFLRAVERVMDGDGWHLIVPRETLAADTHHGWWREVPVYDDETDEPTDSWEYHRCDETDEGAYRVTWVDLADIRRWFVEVCGPCVRGDHDRCRLRTVASIETYMRLARPHPRLTGRIWVSANTW